MRFERRPTLPIMIQLINSIIFVLLALAFCGMFMSVLGFNPLSVYKAMMLDIISSKGIKNSIIAGLPLVFCGLGVAFGYRMNMNNIGGDGQYALGAVFCIWFALYGPVMPPALKITVMFLLALAGGAAAALIAAIPKALWNVSETISSMMLNYIILYVLNYLMYGPWKEKGQMIAQTTQIKKKYWLPEIGDTGISTVLIIAVVIAVFLYWFHKKTTKGYEMEVVRRSPRAAIYAGINVKLNIILVLAISGAICGLAGFAQITSILHRAQADMPAGAGYTGIVIAYLAGLNPIAVVIVGLLFGALQFSAVSVQVLGVPSQIATMIQGSIMLFVIIGSFFNRYRLIRIDGSAERGE